jgi:hypothetical protein
VCRGNAEACRESAARFNDSDKQEALRDIARAWEKLAKNLEREAAERRRGMVA